MNLEDIKVVTIDIETTGLDRFKDKILLIGYRYNGVGEVKQLDVTLGEKDEFLERVLSSSKVTKRGHNVKFDTLFLNAHGYNMVGPYDDTSILCYLEDPFRSNSLKDLVEQKLKRKVTRMEDIAIRPRKRDLENFNENSVYFGPIEGEFYEKVAFKEYNRADIINCDDIRREVITNDWYTSVEQPLIGLFVDVETRGIQINKKHLEDLGQEYEKTLKEIHGTLGLENPRSPKQVRESLLAHGLQVTSTDKLVLKRLCWSGNDFAKHLLRYRELEKLRSTYIVSVVSQLDVGGRLHGSFNQAGHEKDDGGYSNAPKTGRLSSSGPNLQNIPDRTEEGRRIRQAFIPSDGYVMFVSDLKQMEPRLIAHESQSTKLIKAFKEGLDTHGMFASDIFGKSVESLTKIERFIGKTSWLATTYGCWYKKLKEIAERLSEEKLPYDEAFYEGVQERFWAANPEIASWRRSLIEETKSLGFLTTIGGRRIKIPNLNTRNQWEAKEVERQIVNYKIQGSASDIMKLILRRFQDKFPGKVLASVHDEVLGEFESDLQPDAMKLLIEILMCNTVTLKNVNIEADTKIISSWAEK